MTGGCILDSLLFFHCCMRIREKTVPFVSYSSSFLAPSPSLLHLSHHLPFRLTPPLSPHFSHLRTLHTTKPHTLYFISHYILTALLQPYLHFTIRSARSIFIPYIPNQNNQKRDVLLALTHIHTFSDTSFILHPHRFPSVITVQITHTCILSGYYPHTFVQKYLVFV